MKRFIAASALVIASLGAAPAQWVRSGTAPIESASGQFAVFGALSTASASWMPAISAATNFIALQPPLLVVSCERIKQKLWAELGATAPWRGKIYVNLYPARSANATVGIATEASPGGWNYRLALPDTLPRECFVRAVVNVLLLEIANRNAGVHPAELPHWLGEGLCGEMRAENDVELLLPPPTLSVHGLSISPHVSSERWSNPLEHAKYGLGTQPPLTFEQLSWPVEGQLADDGGEIYRCSAQLFVHLLLRLPDGPACLRTMLDESPRYYNWQFAFLHAFRSHFQNLLAVEKWWALQVVQFTGHDLSQMWPAETSWTRLDEIIRSPMDVRTGKGELPLHTEVRLQTIIREWNRARQRQLFQRKLAELDVARLRMAPVVVPLVDDYRRVIQTYLQKINSSGSILTFNRRLGLIPDRAPDEAISRLDVLDLRREALRPQPATAVTAATPTASAESR